MLLCTPSGGTSWCGDRACTWTWLLVLTLILPTALATRASGQSHGIGIAKTCLSPRKVGEINECLIRVTYNDGFDDTLAILDLWDVVNPGPDEVIIPFGANGLEIIEVEGNTTATVGGTLPVLIGPPGSTAAGLPGIPEIGVVTFIQNTYVIDADDPDPLLDQANVTILDLCDDPNTIGCSTLPSIVQFTAETDIIHPGIAVAKAADPPLVCAGGQDVLYTYFVLNPGDSDLEIVSIFDDTPPCDVPDFVGGDDDPPDGLLNPGETWIYECVSPDVMEEVTNTVFVQAIVAERPECMLEEEASFTVGALPSPPCAIDGLTEVCQFSLATYTAPPGLTYAWSTLDGCGAFFSATDLQTVSIGFPSAGPCEVLLTVTDDDGCTSSCSLVVTVNEPPPCFVDGPTLVCAGDVLQLTGPAGLGSYTWSTVANCGTIIGPDDQETVEILFPQAGPCTVRLAVSENGCSTDPCSFFVDVTEPPIVDPNDAAVCAGEVAQLCANPSGGTPPYLFQWTGPGGFTADTECIDVVEAGVYVVVVTDDAGCTSAGEATLVVEPGPDVMIDPSLSSLCAGEQIELCAGAAGGAAPYTFLWSTGETTPCIVVAETGEFSVVVTDANGCSGGNEASVVLVPEPTCVLLPPATPPDCNSGGNLLTVEVLDGVPPYTFGWSVTGSGWMITSGADTDTITYATGTGSATFDVVVTDANGCTTACSTTFACEVDDPFAIGACCLSSGTCWLTTLASCNGSGGDFQGAGSSCATVVCETASGACCFATGCVVIDSAQCIGNGGAYQGDDTTCDACIVVTGSCCLEDGTCQDVTEAECAAIAGSGYEGDGTQCVSTACPPAGPAGACCLQGGACSDVGPATCAGSGGQYLGDGTECGTATCPSFPVTGVCCYTSGVCGFNVQSSCVLSGGTWLGPGFDCQADPCPAPTGACCFGNQCVDGVPIDCLVGGGDFQGTGSTCATTTACAVLGAPSVGNTAGGDVLGAALGDLDGTGAVAGHPDVVVLFEGRLQVLLNEGMDASGAWRGFTALPAHDVAEGISAITLVKLDGDAYPDLALTNPVTSSIHILRNLTDGTFVTQSVIGSDALLGGPSRVVAEDFTGDGADDLIVASEDHHHLVLLVNDGLGNLLTIQAFGGPIGDLRSLRAADLDGDGVADVVVSTTANGADEIRIFMNDGAGLFADPVVRALPTAGADVSLADLEQDGLRDVIVAGAGAGGALSVISNRPAEPFGAAQHYATGQQDAFGLDVSDVTGDGLSDAVVAQGNAVAPLPNEAPAHVILMPGAQPTAGFETASGVNMLAPASWVFAVDVDGNDRADLVSVTDAGLVVTRLSTPAVAPSDCNDNDVADWIDVVTSASTDCNFNDVPDECEDLTGPRRVPHACICPADVDGSGAVDGADVALAMMSIGACPGTSCPGDLDGDGMVDARDLEQILASIGPCPDVGRGPNPDVSW